MISIIRWLLLPISFIYQSVVWIRNRMYDRHILKSQSFDIPTIVIGNLAVGGAGKSPMTEYLIRLLKDKYNMATLSRGYGRKTKGFKTVHVESTALEVGDEPLQFKKKFPTITVAVCEDRCAGIAQLRASNDIILLDDAYQHRKLQAGLYLLLFDYSSLFKPLLTLPTGNFRDNFSSSKRANLIVITKVPDTIPEKDKQHIEGLIRKYSKAPIFYSSIRYSKAINYADNKPLMSDLSHFDIVLFCGIANPIPLIEYLKNKANSVTLIEFPDHHNYSANDFNKVITHYKSFISDHKIIMTTEKDIQRITNNVFADFPLYYIPIQLDINTYQNHTLDYYVEKYIETSR